MAQTISVWESEGSSMVDSWTTNILCTRRKDGSVSLRLRSVGEDGVISPRGFVGIRTADRFTEKLQELICIAGGQADADELAVVCEKLTRIDPVLAANV